MRSVSIPIHLSINCSTSSREQWLALSRMFVQSSAAQEHQLCQALQEAKKENCSIQHFYSLLFRYWEELQTMNVLFSDFMSVFALEFHKQRDRQNLFHLPCDFILNLRHLVAVFSIAICYPASLKQ